MAKKETVPATLPDTTAVSAILALTCKRHQKVWLLHKTGMKQSEIARQMGTNAGHVGNVMRDYREHPEKAEKAEALQNQPTEE